MKKAFILHLLTVFVIFSIPFTNTYSTILVGILISTKTNTNPTIDGAIDPYEWSLSNAIDITLYKVCNIYDTITVNLVSMYSDSNVLFIGADIFTDITDFYFLVIFRTDMNAPIFKNITSFSIPNQLFGGDNDIKRIDLNTSSVHDCLCDADTMDYKFDLAVGGTMDISGAALVFPNHISLEFSCPFDTHDTQGGDFVLTSGSQIEISILLIGFDWYTQIRHSDRDFDYISLEILPTTNTINIPLIITGITSVFLLIIENKRK